MPSAAAFWNTELKFSLFFPLYTCIEQWTELASTLCKKHKSKFENRKKKRRKLPNVVTISRVPKIPPQLMKSHRECADVQWERATDKKSFNFIRTKFSCASVCVCVCRFRPSQFYHYHCRHRCMFSMCACEKHVLTNTLAMAQPLQRNGCH